MIDTEPLPRPKGWWWPRPTAEKAVAADLSLVFLAATEALSVLVAVAPLSSIRGRRRLHGSILDIFDLCWEKTKKEAGYMVKGGRG